MGRNDIYFNWQYITERNEGRNKWYSCTTIEDKAFYGHT